MQRERDFYYLLELTDSEIFHLINCIITEKERVESDIRRSPADKIAKIDFDKLENLHTKLSASFEAAPIKIRERA